MQPTPPSKPSAAPSRLLVVSPDLCKPKNCKRECQRTCPVVRMGKACVQVTGQRAHISENLCIGCGICVKKCPLSAISMVSLPAHLSATRIVHRFGANSFALLSLPAPAPGRVLGLVGPALCGKSTALRILAGKLCPNLGITERDPGWPAFLGSDLVRADPALEAHFTRLVQDRPHAVVKPQHIDQIPRTVHGTVRQVLTQRSQRGAEHLDAVIDALYLRVVLDRDISEIGAGGLQCLAIAATCVQEADIYVFDEFTAYLDVGTRYRAARLIRSLARATSCVIISDRDIGVVECAADSVAIGYCQAGAYGAFGSACSARDALNAFWSGVLPSAPGTSVGRFRPFALDLTECRLTAGAPAADDVCLEYGAFSKCYADTYRLRVAGGAFAWGAVTILLGRNGSGKTTLLRALAHVQGAGGDADPPHARTVSYKPQAISPRWEGTVYGLFQAKVPHALLDECYLADVYAPLGIGALRDEELRTVSGRSLQCVALALTLAKEADVYLLDEPFLFLDSEMRATAAHLIKRFARQKRKCVLIAEHDLALVPYLADRVIVIDGVVSADCTARAPDTVVGGMEQILRSLDLTMRCSGLGDRPRLNTLGSARETSQREAGRHFQVAD